MDGERIVIVGAGAMGSLLAARLALAEIPVALYSRPSGHLTAVQRDGLVLEEEDGRRARIALPATSHPAILGMAWLVVVLVKTWQTAAALVPLRDLVPADAAVLTLQNGLGNPDAIRDALGPREVIVGVTTQAALRTEPGVVRHTGGGLTALGREDGRGDARVTRAVRALNEAGWPAVAVADIERWVWRKLAVNAAINPLTALAGVSNRVVAEEPRLRAQAAALATEVATVAAAHGHDLGGAEAVAALVEEVARATGDNRSSMLRDLERGERTEIEAINGAVVAAGARLGIATPANLLMTELVRAREGANLRACLEALV